MGRIGNLGVEHLGVMPNVTNKNALNLKPWVRLGPGLDIWA